MSCAREVARCTELRGSGKGFQKVGVGRERKGWVEVEKRGANMTSSRGLRRKD
jgi:hypothetical protein